MTQRFQRFRFLFLTLTQTRKLGPQTVFHLVPGPLSTCTTTTKPVAPLPRHSQVDSWATGHDPGPPCSSRRCCSLFPGGCRESPEPADISWPRMFLFKIPLWWDPNCFIPWSPIVLLGSLKGKSASTNPPPIHPVALCKAWNSLSAGVCTASRTKVQPVPTKKEKNTGLVLQFDAIGHAKTARSRPWAGRHAWEMASLAKDAAAHDKTVVHTETSTNSYNCKPNHSVPHTSST